MHLTLHIVWSGTRTTHTATVTAAPASDGAHLAAELARLVGTEHRATVEGLDLARLTVGAAPLVDGATVVLLPVADDREHTATGRPERTDRMLRPLCTESPAAADTATEAPGDEQDATTVEVVEGTGAGTRLVLTRGRCDVVLQDDGPVLLPPGSPSTSGADLSLLLDDTGLKVLPTGTRLGSGDRVRLHRGGRLSWLRVELPAAPGSSPSWPGEQEPPPGITVQEANPSRPLTVDAPSRRRARLTMITGALPLLAGIGIAVVTHWWFFLVFSALGAVTTVVGWVGERGARRETSNRLRAALDRDLRRCAHAAPSAAEVLHRCRARTSDRGFSAAGHTSTGSVAGAAFAPRAAPEPVVACTPTGAGRQVSGRPRLELDRAAAARWVRLGHGARAGNVTRGHGVGVREVWHPSAPVIVDLAALPSLALALDHRRAAGVLNALVVQLFTGPGALGRLVVSPDLAWQAPLRAETPAESTPPQEDEPPGTAGLEVLTADDARTRPRRTGLLRVVVAHATPLDDGEAVLAGAGAQLRLTTRRCDAVPGLSGEDQRFSIEFLPDTVGSEQAARAVAAWARVSSAGVGTAGGRLPRRLGSHELLALTNHDATLPPSHGPGAHSPGAHGLGAYGGTPAHPQGTEASHDAVSADTPCTRAGHSPAAAGPANVLSAAFGVSRAGVEHIQLSDEHPHLLIAGTTGCGKSEVLRTIVAGLAAQCPPRRLEFVFIDFKGGAALAPLTGLPHLTTLLTDLGADEIRRALLFLRSELRRRELVLAAHGLRDMAEVLGRDAQTPAIRELVVVVDEAKMLTDAFPEAAQELAVVATVGRSLGVHLVLATQRPQGALPADVRTNVTQALCLRVRTEQESVDVVGGTQAARIPSGLPGRGYLDRGDGPAVEVQAAVLTRMRPPAPPSPVVTFTDPARHHGPPRAGRSVGPADSGPPPDVAAAVRDVADSWASADETPALLPDDPRGGPGGSRAVPPALPANADALPSGVGDAVDLGPAENPAEHWSGRAAWRPWEDGALALIGRPAAVHGWFSALLRRCAALVLPGVSAANPVALYVITASDHALDGVASAEGVAAHPALRGWARADEPGDVAHLLDTLRAGLGGLQESVSGAQPRAVLAVEDWDRCCQHFRAGSWAHLEDDVLALVSTGTALGLSALVTGDRALATGRASHVGPNRLHLPEGQSPDALLQWPRLPPFSAHPGRAALSGPAADRCAPGPAAPRAERMAVVQLAGGDAAPAGPARRSNPCPTTTAVPDTALAVEPLAAPHPWPPAFPLPRSWTPPTPRSAGLVLGVTRDGSPCCHPWGPGSTLVVAGPARSGRSSFLAAARAHLDPEAGAAHQRPSTARHDVLHPVLHTAEDVTALLRRLGGVHRPTTVVLDDADRLAPDVLRAFAAAWTGRPEVSCGPRKAHPAPSGPTTTDPRAVASSSGGSARRPRTTAIDGDGLPLHGADPALPPATEEPWLRPGVRVIVGIQLTDSPAATFPPLLTWRHTADALVLRPRRSFDGDTFGASFTGQPLGGPPGRGFWVHRGTVTPLQCPLPPTGS